MRLDIILADAAESADGKAYILGAGWSTQTGPAPMAVVIFTEVPWDRTNQRMRILLELLDGDGQPVSLPGPSGPQPLRVEGEMEAGRPPGLARGTPVTLVPLTMTFGPLPLDPGRYVWRVSVDEHTEETWQRSFTRVAG